MYNKIFTRILDSSIWLEPTPTRIVWITMIAAMDERGYCHFAAIGNLASRAQVSLEDATAAVKILESPDPESSDPDNDGRRIERVPGGWMVLNAEKYRAIVTRAEVQEKTRQRVNRWREKKRDVTGCNASVTPSNVLVTQSEAYTEAHTKTKSAAKAATDPRFTPFKEKIKAYVEYMKEPFVWDGSESRALSLLLKATPDLTADDFSLFLRNRAKSEVALGDRPRKWIPSITSYTVPLDRFGKPQEARRAFGRPDPSVGVHRSQEGGKESQGGALSVDGWRSFRDSGAASYKYCPPDIRKIIESEDAK